MRALVVFSPRFPILLSEATTRRHGPSPDQPEAFDRAAGGEPIQGGRHVQGKASDRMARFGSSVSGSSPPQSSMTLARPGRPRGTQTAPRRAGRARAVRRIRAGMVRMFSASGPIDRNNPFFQSLGTNGRACVTCHQPADGWTITPAHVQARFDATRRHSTRSSAPTTAPTRRAPTSRRSTARRAAYSMLLAKGLIRVGIGIPAGRRVHARRGRRSVRLRQRRGAVAVPPAAAVDQPQVPERR